VPSSTLLSPDSVLDALRGNRASRPVRDTTSAATLRAALERELAGELDAVRSREPLVLSAASLRRPAHASDLNDAARARLRGALVSVLLRLHVVGATLGRPFDDALGAWLAEGPSPALVEHLESLDDDDRARLATDVTAHYVTLSRALGEVPAEWNARTAVRASVRISDGRVVLRDTLDLVIGSAHADVAAVVLFDVTTGPLGEGAERVLRYHALVETLRTSVVPLRSAVFSSATGELWMREVDPEMLTRAIDELVSAASTESRAS
jgi:hypothetical protein